MSTINHYINGVPVMQPNRDDLKVADQTIARLTRELERAKRGR